MRRKKPADAADSRAWRSVQAGDFAVWMQGMEASLRSGSGGLEVPCGNCRGCCRASMFIHIRPDEARTIARIPRALLFAAPGMPKGHVLMGYGDDGACPMLKNNECSIYEDRPQTCRDYDCRVFAATGVAVDGEGQPEVAERVKAWVFGYEREVAGEEHAMLQEAARFLQANGDLFPQGSLPSYPVQMAVLAVRVFRVFAEMRGREVKEGLKTSDAAIASAMLVEMSRTKDVRE